jgi:hypothetical protein
MKLENIISDIRHILNSYSDNSSIQDEFLINRINAWRSIETMQYNDIYGYIPAAMYQTETNIDTEIVNSADDNDVSRTSVIFAKHEMPRLLILPDGKELKRVMFVSQQKDFQRITEKQMYKLIETEDELLHDYSVYFQKGDVLYFYPHVNSISITYLLYNPLEGKTRNALVSPQGNTISTSGTVRNLTVLDDYPLTPDLANRVILKLLEADFQIKMSQIQDIVSDKQDQLNILTNERARATE